MYSVVMMTNGLVIALAVCTTGQRERMEPNVVAPVEVVLTRGGQLEGELIDQDDHTVTIEHPILGCLTIDRSDIVVLLNPNVVRPSADAPPPVDGPGRSGQAGTTQAVLPFDRALLPSVLRPPASPGELEADIAAWTGRLGAALTASRTTVSTYNLRLSGQAGRQDETERTNLSVSYYLNTSDGQVTDNDLLFRGDQNWYVADSILEFFLQATYQYDQFEAWAHRVSPYGGVGWRVVDEEQGSLTLKLGGGATWENDSGVVRPQALGEMTGSWVFNERNAVRGYASIAPNVEALDDFLATIKVDWDIRLSSESPLALNLGVRTIYDSTPGPGSTSTDFKAWAGVNWSF